MNNSFKNKNVVTSLDEFEDKLMKIDKESIKFKELEKEGKNKYLFKQVKSSSYNYQLFDQNNNLKYESKKIKYRLFKGVKVEFINKINNESKFYQIGLVSVISKTHSNSYNMPFKFKIDGISIWKLLEKMDIKIEGSPYSGNVIYKDFNIGTYNKIKFNKISFNYRKRNDIEIICNKEFIDIMFLVSFAMSYLVNMNAY